MQIAIHVFSSNFAQTEPHKSQVRGGARLQLRAPAMRTLFFATMKIRLFIGSGMLGLLMMNAHGAEQKPTPAAEKNPVFNEYHGTKVEDDYQWLENDDDAAVKAWSDAENTRTRAYLDGLSSRSAIEKQLTAWYAKTSPSYSAIVARPGKLFAMKFQPPKQQPMLVTLASADDLKSEKVLVDPNKIDSKGTTAIDWFEPSLDGTKVAVSLSKGGSEDGTLHFFDAAAGKELGDTIAHVQYPTAGGSAAWNADGSGVYYTRFPRKGERPEEDLNFYQQVYFHKLGTSDSKDTYAIGKDFPRIAEIKLESSLRRQIYPGYGGKRGRWRFRPLFVRPRRRVEADHAIQRPGKAGPARAR